MHGRTKVPVGGNDIEATIVVEVVNDQATYFIIDCAEAGTRCHVGKAAKVFCGFKVRRCQQVLFRYPGRIFAQRHIGKIQQPPGLDIVRSQLERSEEVLDGFLRIRTLDVAEFGANRKKAHLPGMAVYVVDRSGAVEVGHAQHLFYLG